MEELPKWKAGEELANSLTHAVGVGFAISMLVVFIIDGNKTLNDRKLLGNVIFGITMIILYANSTVYHGLPENKVKTVWRYVDHISVFYLIAGTYTPICLNLIWETKGKYMLAIIWGLALLGTAIKILFFDGFYILSLIVYLVMGWLIAFALTDIKKNAKEGFAFWLILGGISYSTGVLFFAADQKIPFFHMIFHFFILFGTISHSIACLNYI